MADSKTHNYPDPTASTGGNAGPYHQRPADDPENTIEAQLQHQLQGPGNEHTGPFEGAHPDYTHAYPYGTPQMPMQQGPSAQVMSDTSRGHDVTGDIVGETPKAKKTKVTRACDECRRKKIRCDATGDDVDGGAKCSNCQRTSAECLFTKPAQKRGPSRGYIRELAERVNVLETERTGAGRRRSYSEFESGQRGHPHPRTPQPTTPGQNSGMNFGTPQMTFPQHVAGQMSSDEANLIKAFMTVVTDLNFPSFFKGEDECKTLVAQVAGRGRTTFFQVVAAILSFDDNQTAEVASAYNGVFNACTETPENLPPLDNLLNLVNITHVLFATSYWGHPKLQAQTGNVAAAGSLYGSAVSIASHLRVHAQQDQPVDGSAEAALIFYVGRRCVWNIACINSWDAIAYDKMRNFDVTDFGKFKAGDVVIFGHKTQPLAGITQIMTRLHHVLRDTDMPKEIEELAYQNAALSINLIEANIMDDVELTLPTVAIIVAGIVAEQGANSMPNSLLFAKCQQVVDRLVRGPDIPMAHHFVGIIVRFCIEASDFTRFKGQAVEVLKNVVDGIRGETILKHNLSKTGILRKTTEKLDSLGGLQHLANTAVMAIGEKQTEMIEKDWKEIFFGGYLNYFL